MPIYEYECAKCTTRFDVLVRSDADYPKACTKCGSKKIGKALSAFAVTSGMPDGAACPTCPSAKSCGAGTPCCGE